MLCTGTSLHECVVIKKRTGTQGDAIIDFLTNVLSDNPVHSLITSEYPWRMDCLPLRTVDTVARCGLLLLRHYAGFRYTFTREIDVFITLRDSHITCHRNDHPKNTCVV